MIRRVEEIAVHPLEIAIDLLFANDPLDCINGSGMAFGCKASPIIAMQVRKVKETVVEHRAEMCGRALGLAGADHTVLQDNDGLCPP